MSEWGSKVASEPVGKRGSRDLESVLEYASRIRAFVGLVEEEEQPPPLPEPLVLDRTPPVGVDGEQSVVSSREDALSDEIEESAVSDSQGLDLNEGDGELKEEPTSSNLPEVIPVEAGKDGELEEQSTLSDSPELAPVKAGKDDELEGQPTSSNPLELVPAEAGKDRELEEQRASSNLPEVIPVEAGKDVELGEQSTVSDSSKLVPVEDGKDDELEQPSSSNLPEVISVDAGKDNELEQPTSSNLSELAPGKSIKGDEIEKQPTSTNLPELVPVAERKDDELGKIPTSKKASSLDISSDSSFTAPDLREENLEIAHPSVCSGHKNETENSDSYPSDNIDVNPGEFDVNGTQLNLNEDLETSSEFPNMDSGFGDEGSSLALLDNSCKERNEGDLHLNGLKRDSREPIEQNGVINNGFDDEGCVKDGITDEADDRNIANDSKPCVDLKEKLPSVFENDQVQTKEKTSTENEVVSSETQNNEQVGNKEPEMFLFDPEYVEDLQNESPDPKPIPDMALLRRLSQDVVNKVLDDAGSQIREIFDERKRSSVVELNKSPEVPISDKNFTEIQLKVPEEKDGGGKEAEPEMDTLCGIGSYHPKWIQPYATARTYIILYSIIGMLSGAYYTYLIGTISTLEKRFAFKSKISGTIMIVDEITPLLLGVLVGYFGGKAHRPRMVALGMLLSAVCCFVSAMPYFIYGPATHLNVLNFKNETSLGLCDGEGVQESCDSDDRPPTMTAILFLMLGSFLKGFGNLAYYAIGLAYMDDNAKKKNSPMYFAVSMTLRLVGPLLGFLLSSACLKFYENPFVDPGFGREDPRWIGAWWMGFLLQGVLLLIFVVPIALFPRRISGHKYPAESAGDKVPNFKGLIAALKRLGKNPLFVFIVLNTIMAVFGGFGHYIMLPKYMENQFHMSASDASLLSGPPGLAAVMTSTIIGGSLIWKFKPSAKILTAGMLAVEVIAALGFLLLMIPQCERVQMTNFGRTDESLILDSVCNFNCNCTTASYTPVCGPDGRTTYFSPCYAGCSEGMNKTFTNCSCVPESFGEPTVTEGYCAVDDCWTQVLAYIITLPIMQLIVSLMRVAHTMILLRSIEPEDKSVALGTFETLLCAFGFIPFPIVYGSLVDSTCLVWERSCGRTGNCWFYDVDKFNYLLHGASAGFSVMSVLCLIVIFLLSGRVKNLYDEDEKTEEKLDPNVIKI